MSQDPYTFRYFRWYNWMEDTTVELSLKVGQGSADLYIQTYDEDTSEVSLVDALPKSKSKARWFLENIRSTTQESSRKYTIIAG